MGSFTCAISLLDLAGKSVLAPCLQFGRYYNGVRLREGLTWICEMEATMLFTADSPGNLSVVVRGGGRVASNAGDMIVKRISDESAIVPTRCDNVPAASEDVAITLEIEPSGIAEGFHLVIDDHGARIVGNDPQGVLYGACEFLERIECSPGRVVAGALDIRRQPDLPFRAINHTGMYPPVLRGHDSPEMRSYTDALKSLITWGARMKANVFVPTHWPENTTSALTFRYFPPVAEFVSLSRAAGYQAHFKEIIEFAEGSGLSVFLPFTEFHFPLDVFAKERDWAGTRSVHGRELQPYRNPCASHPYTRKVVEAKVREVLELFPSVAGLELWVGEKENNILYCDCAKCRSYPAQERILDLITWYYDAMKSIDPEKKLIVRTYLCAGRCYREPELFGPIAGRLPKDIVVCLKGQYGDFNYLNDPHPLVGTFGENTQVVEFDLGGEYRGYQKGYHSSILDYVEERMEYYRGKGAQGFMFRHLDWLNAIAREDAEAVFAKCWDNTASCRETALRGLERRFGARAADGLMRIGRLGREIVEKDLHIRGINAYGRWGTIPEDIHRMRYNIFDHSARMIDGGEERLLECIETPGIAMEEKKEAAELNREFKDELEGLKDDLPASLYEGLMQSADITRMLISLHSHTTEILLYYLKYERALYKDERLELLLKLHELIEKCRTWISLREESEGWYSVRRVKDKLACRPVGQDVGVPWYRPDEQSLSLQPAERFLASIERQLERSWEYYSWNLIPASTSKAPCDCATPTSACPAEPA